jgi:hypothetical protein
MHQKWESRADGYVLKRYPGGYFLMFTNSIKTASIGLALATALVAFPNILNAQTSTTTTTTTVSPTATAIPYIAPAGAPEPNDISSASSSYSETSVFVGGTSIMRVRFAAGGFTPEERAAEIQHRVNRLLSHGPIVPTDVTVTDFDSADTGVYVKGHLLFMADAATANYNQTSAHDLAESWASTMRRVLPDLTQPE